MATPTILMAIIVFMAMFLGRFMPWERLLRRRLSTLEIVFATVFSIAIPFTVLAVMHPDGLASGLILIFWLLTACAVIGSAISSLLNSYIAFRSRAEEAEERETKLVEDIKK